MLCRSTPLSSGTVHARPYAYLLLPRVTSVPGSTASHLRLTYCIIQTESGETEREGAKPESNNRWKSDLGHVGMHIIQGGPKRV